MSLAFVFPGQGSQKVGMLAELAEQYPVIQATFAEASEALGYDMWDMVQNGEQETLNLTENTQPILLTSSTALYRLWCEKSELRPTMMAGHSLGEFSALVAAGALQFQDAVRLVRDRGRFMQTAVPVGEGAMAAVLGLDDEQVRAACAQAAEGDVVEAVNFNAPGQVVIAGSAAAVERAIFACKEAGAKRAMPLPVSVPSHCALMKPAADKLAETLNATNFHAAEMPVINNVDVAMETAPEQIRDALIRQLYSPVRWVETIQALKEQGVSHVYECGPGKVLSGLIKRIDRDIAARPLENGEAFEAALKGE